MAALAQQERHALCDTLQRVGPDAPTLCEGWTTRHLAVHLIVREGRPDAALGTALPVLRGHARSVTQALHARPWAELVDRVRTGPPRLSPFSVPGVNERANLVELFVHHEDVLRAADPAARRPSSPQVERRIWQSLPLMGRITLRRAPVGVVAHSDGYGRRPLRSARSGEPTVTLLGRPSEVLLHVSGRAGADGARVDVRVEGTERAVTAFSGADTAL